MPAYIPVTPGNSDRNSLIECYFNLVLDYAETLSFLLLVHGIPAAKSSSAYESIFFERFM